MVLPAGVTPAEISVASDAPMLGMRPGRLLSTPAHEGEKRGRHEEAWEWQWSSERPGERTAQEAMNGPRPPASFPHRYHGRGMPCPAFPFAPA